MKTYAIGDLHGRLDLLERALLTIHDREPGHVVTLGDYIDRGPDSKGVIELVMHCHKSPAWTTNGWSITSIKGNHEEMLTATVDNRLDPSWWIGNGGDATLRSYGLKVEKRQHIDHDDLDVIPKAHVQWMRELPKMRIDARRIYVHAGVNFGTPIHQQNDDVIMWMRYAADFEGFGGNSHVVHGHTPHLEPQLHSGRTNLDTKAFATGRLAIGVFDDAVMGGPIEIIDIRA
jgi:serine/threonine protein phosphatase 1